MNYVYPKSEFLNGVYTTYNIKDSSIEKLKQKLQKITGKSEQIIFQTEYIYRDLVKVESSFENKQKELYVKKQTNSKYNPSTKNLHIIYNIQELENYNFPNLNSYHHVEKKEIHKYGDVLLIKNNKYWTICINYELKESVEKLFEQVMVAISDD